MSNMRYRDPHALRPTFDGWAAAWLALLAGWLVLAWPWLSGRVTIPWDATGHFLPQLQFLAASFARGELPFWTPNVFAGHPQIADPQSLIFSPPYLILALLEGKPTAWDADATLYLLLLVSAAAMLMWLRDRGYHPAACTLSALSFAFGASMAWRVQHIGQVMSLAYLPMVLFLLDRALQRRSAVYGLGAGVVAGFLVLGRDQVALLSVYLLAAYVLAGLWSQQDRRQALRDALPPLLAATVAGVLVIALPTLLTALVAADSNRPSIDLEGAGRGSLHPAHLLTLVAPDAFGASGYRGDYWGPPSIKWGDTGLYLAQNMGQLYLGAIPALLIVWGFVSGTFFAHGIRFFTLALCALLLYALGKYTPVFSWLHAAMPGVNLYRRPADATFLIGFVLSVLAGYAAHRMLTDHSSPKELRRTNRAIVTAILVAIFALLVGLGWWHGMLAVAWPDMAIPAALFLSGAALMRYVRRRWSGSGMAATLLLAGFLTADLAWSNGPGNATALPPQTYDVLNPVSSNATIAMLKELVETSHSDTRRDRVEIVGFGFDWPNASLTHGLENTLGYNPLRLGLYTRATGAGDHAGLPEQKGFSALMPSYRSTLADLLGLRYIATSVPVTDIDKSLKPGALKEIARTKQGYIYENPGALPRVLFATSARKADFAALMTSGAWPDVDYRTTVLLEGDANPGPRAPGWARLTAYHNTSVSIETDSADGGFVVLNDVYQPWWSVTVDGVEAPLLRANVLFRAVEVPRGRHTVVFSFHPIRGALRQVLQRR